MGATVVGVVSESRPKRMKSAQKQPQPASCSSEEPHPGSVPVTPERRLASAMAKSANKLTEETRKRLEIMVRTNDGFEIAEADLKLRGPGDLEGTQQSGIAFDLKIADIARDGQLLQYVRTIAEEITDADPGGVLPENAILWQQLRALRKTNVNWAAIS